MENRGELNISIHYGFSRRGVIDPNFHFYQEGNPEIESNLLFRDYLGHHPCTRDPYASLEINLLQDDSGDQKRGLLFIHYTLEKTDFICDVLKEVTCPLNFGGTCQLSELFF